ncbi:haloacid dehalogenase-like hydrolase domain-containing protein 3 [Amia ocellicauda]|uniref:haloacid dehalogenase-like hydrolase domain-containing protein 3 n=1 Tax=Amia ocellicauda TaxID=2972642 RepID=UPI0034646502|nr:HDHD3 protein [Amia calva]
MRVRWVTWDVKDTLLRVRHSVGEQYCGVARELGLTLDPEAVEAAFHSAYRQQQRRQPLYGGAGGGSARTWWGEVVCGTFRSCGVEDGERLRLLAERLYQGFSGPAHWEVFPDVTRALQGCGARGLAQAVLSNFDGRLEDVLRGCGLREHFRFVLTSESAGAAKPDSRAFLRLLELAGQPAPGEVAHVGDSYQNDYLPARALGLHAFLLQRGSEEGGGGLEVPPHHRLRSLDELLPRLEQDLD